MTRLLTALFFVLYTAFGATAQQPDAAAAAKSTAPAANDIFSGTVTAYGVDSLTVVRKVPAKADESRVFVVDKDTKIEGKPKVNARVTVRFKADGDGAVHALRIIVRADVKAGGGAPKTPAPATKR